MLLPYYQRAKVYAQLSLSEGLPLIIYGDGEQTRDFVNVQDVVQLVKLALAKKLRGCIIVAREERQA